MNLTPKHDLHIQKSGSKLDGRTFTRGVVVDLDASDPDVAALVKSGALVNESAPAPQAAAKPAPDTKKKSAKPQPSATADEPDLSLE